MKQIKIGRSNSCDVVIDDDTISREHAELFQDDEGNTFLTDLDSSNGTFINGKQLIGSAQISFNDIIKIGNSVLPWRNYLKGEYKPPEIENQEIKLEEIKKTSLDSMEKAFRIPLFVGWIINTLAWGLFVLTFNHLVELIIGIICLFAFFIGYKHENRPLIYLSIFTAVWMFVWALGILDYYNFEGYI